MTVGSCTPIVIDETGNASVGTIFINEVMASNASSAIDPLFKGYPDWIELYNAGNKVIDLSTHFITDNLERPTKWPIPEGTVLGPGEFILFWADGMDIYDHTNFKLEKGGEEIGLYNSVGTLVDHVKFDSQLTDVSFGRMPDGSSSLYYFGSPSAGSANDGNGARNKVFAGAVQISVPGGFYTGSQLVELSAELADTTIKYTLDGSMPGKHSATYSQPIHIDVTSVLRARTFKEHFLPGPILTNTYLIDEEPSLPVISISTNPENFFDEEFGIYIKGKNAEPTVPYYGSNFLEDWERPINLEYFEADGTLGFNLITGIKIFGGNSAANDQRSFAFYPREKYSVPFFHYKLFPDKDIHQFKRFIVRNSGQDWASSLFRDGFHQTLIMGQMDIDYQSYKPVLVFLNGEFWGLYNLREKIDVHYFSDNYNIDVNTIDLLAHNNQQIQVSGGSKQHYDAMLAFLESNDTTLPESFNYIKTQMDTDEYMNYLIIQFYLANTDWPGENTKMWRRQTDNSRWRWILFDTDFGSGMYDDYFTNMLTFATAVDGPEWPNPPWATYLIRKLLECPQFKEEFIQRFAAHLNTTFLTERVLQILEQLKAEREQAMERAIKRWGNHIDETMGILFPTSSDIWESNLDVIRLFAVNRPVYMRRHIDEFFGLNGTFQLKITTNNTKGGKVLVNGVNIPGQKLSGPFFKDVPFRLQVIPAEGYRFSIIGNQTIAAKQSSDFNTQTGAKITLANDSEINIVFSRGR